jgi:three-Cys-motif partner protein
MGTSHLRFDQIGQWSQIKLDIVREYAKAYSTILAKQPFLKHVYIDAFAGAGAHQMKSTGEFIAGSPLNALHVEPPFHELHLIDLDGAKIDHLREIVGDRKGVFFYQEDCNRILLEKVFPRVRYEDYRRGLCLLDPYGLNLNWDVLAKAGEMRSIEIFLNFPMMDMNRNALWRNAAGVAQEDAERMTAFWGDTSWRDAVYVQQPGLFGGEDWLKSAGNEEIVRAYRKRLQDVAGFPYVPEPIPMRNSRNATVYYLFFASHNQRGGTIAGHILKKYARLSGGALPADAR